MDIPPKQTVIECKGFGEADVLCVATRSVPVPEAGQVLIKVRAAGVNRADILQRRGKYPPPEGASDVLGLEIAGEIVALGSAVARWKLGDAVCALLDGGGYAEYAVVAATQCLPKPENLSWGEAAALPEAFFTITAHLLSGVAQAKAGETILIHGGSSGIGSIAIQLLRQLNMKVVTTVGTEEKAKFCRDLGADIVVNYKATDFVEAVRHATGGQGVDVVWDMVGGDYVPKNLSLLRLNGRHISLATQQSHRAEIDLRLVMKNQLIVTGTTVRARKTAEKAELAKKIEENLWGMVGAGLVKSLIYQVLPIKNAAEAHKVMENGNHMGKIVIEVAG